MPSRGTACHGVFVLVGLLCGMAAAVDVASSGFKNSDGQGDTRIIGGQAAPDNRYPYMATLQTAFFDHRCGGTLIAPDVVLSAGHCAHSFVEVHIGRYYVHANSTQSESFAVAEQIVHPLYNYIDLPHDFLLIKLDGVSSIKPVQLNRNPLVPMGLMQLTTMGWGRTSSQDASLLANILQEAQVVYIENQQCQEAWSRINITSDMLCTSSDTRGVGCQGDSGGPLILHGSGPDVDLQVGIVSWGAPECDDLTFPSVSSRISDELDWIESVVCQVSSDPPEGFNCGVTYSPAPTVSPTTLTISPAPSAAQVALTISVQLDAFPQETGWTIEDSLGASIAGVNPGTYKTPSDLVQQTVLVNPGESFTFIAIDSAGDGLCCEDGTGYFRVYLGSSKDGILLLSIGGTFEGLARRKFSSSPDDSVNAPQIMLANATSGDFPVTLQIQFDDYPTEFGWTLERLDGAERESIVVIPAGTYVTPGATVSEVTMLSEGGLYALTLTDRGANGLCCRYGEGSIQLLLGSTGINVAVTRQSGWASQSLRSDFGADFLYTFVARSEESSSTIASDRTDERVLSLKFEFDDYPQEIGWIVLKDASAANLTSDSDRADEDMVVYAFGPTKPYSSRLARKDLVEEVVLPPMSPNTKQGFRIIVHDSSGDGLCCAFGRGLFRLYLGPVESGLVLVSGSVTGKEREAHDFTLRGDVATSAGSHQLGSVTVVFATMSTFAFLVS